MKKTLILLLAVSMLCSCQYFSAGSYAYAEIYHLDIREDSLINLIENFKKEHPKFKVPEKYHIIDGKDSHWNFISFYSNQKIYCTWTREKMDGKSVEFAFIGIYKDIDKSKIYVEINKQSDEEDEKDKKYFEDVILSNILKNTKVRVKSPSWYQQLL